MGHDTAGSEADVGSDHAHVERIGLVSLRPNQGATAHRQGEGLLVELALAEKFETRAGIGRHAAGPLFGTTGIGTMAHCLGLDGLGRARRHTGRDPACLAGIYRTVEGDPVHLIVGAQLPGPDHQHVHQRQMHRLARLPFRLRTLGVSAEHPIRPPVGSAEETHVRPQQLYSRQHDLAPQQRPEAQLQVDALDGDHLPAAGPCRIADGESAHLHVRMSEQ